MEIFTRSPYATLTGLEWLVLLVVLGGVAFSVARVSDAATAALMILTSIAFGAFEAPIAVGLGIGLAATVVFLTRAQLRYSDSEERAMREGLVLGAVFALSAAVWNPNLTFDHDARINTQAVIDFEHILRIDPERALQSLLLEHDGLLRLANLAYMLLFLPFVAATLCWLYLTQEQRFRQYRTAVAISAFLAFVVVTLHPVIPPGMMPGSGLIDTLRANGGESSAIASLPSLHVGWVALSGLALFASVQGRIRWMWLVLPATSMTLIVLATGRNYTVDVVVGVVIAAGPFAVIQWIDQRLGGPYYFSLSLLAPRRVGLYLNSVAREIADVPRLRASVYSLGFLLTYLIARQAVDPGFTRYWGYMVAQIALTILIIVVLSVHFAEEGGFSVFTHGIIIVTTYADTFGTAAHMYDRFISYDKFTHFLGCAAVTSAMGDVLINMARRGTIDWAPSKLILVAMGLAIGAGMAWEIYEFIGDKLLDTGRHNGRVDTTYDLISDTIGALVAGCFLYWWHFIAPPEIAPNRQAVPLTSSPGSDDDLPRVDMRSR